MNTIYRCANWLGGDCPMLVEWVRTQSSIGMGLQTLGDSPLMIATSYVELID